MKKTIEERVRVKLLRVGKKNQVCRVLMLPVLTAWVFLFRAMAYCKGNGKRFSMIAMTALLFVVYSSFSFPIFVTSSREMGSGIGEGFSETGVSLAEEEELDISDVELLDDEDVLEGYEYDETSHGMDIIDKYKAEDILKSTEGREQKPESAGTDIYANAYNGVGEEDFEKRGKPVDMGGFSKDDWRLVLINKQHSIPEDYTFELGNITSNMRCDKRIIDDLLDMLQAAREDGINLVICSPYRDTERQEMLFNRKITRYMNKGMSFVEAYQLASQAVTVPGASEHQIGLALDIVSDEYITLDEGFGDTEAGCWLAQNSCRFGFILRYPSGREYITGIEYEPWHFRYVGTEAAMVITEKGITLEEFWEDLE